MKRITLLCTLMAAILAGPMLSGPLGVARADEVELRRLLHGPDRCDHVIGLLMRHGVNNDSSMPSVHMHHPLGPIAIPVTEMGDLELVSICRHGETSAGCGPSFNLVIKNCSTRDVCGSHVTLVGLLGRILPTSPNVTAKIESLPAGEAVQVTVTLPIESLAMGNLNGQMIAFNRVLVVIDSYDQFMESNEANNLRVFDAASIPESAAAVIETPAPIESAETSTEPGVTTALNVNDQAAEPSSPSDSGVEFSSTDLRSAIDQFTNGATTPQDAS